MTAADDQRAAQIAEQVHLAVSTGAQHMFKLYTAYLAAGFAPHQAMAVVLTIIQKDLENNT